MVKNNMMVDFIIMKKADKAINLGEFNEYIPIEGAKDLAKDSMRK
jgi:hypothetical protein